MTHPVTDNIKLYKTIQDSYHGTIKKGYVVYYFEGFDKFYHMYRLNDGERIPVLVDVSDKEKFRYLMTVTVDELLHLKKELSTLFYRYGEPQ